MKGGQPSSMVKLNPNRAWEPLNRTHMNQNDLARPSDTSPGCLSLLISGTRRPSAMVFKRLGEAPGARLRSRTKGFDLVRPRRHECPKRP